MESRGAGPLVLISIATSRSRGDPVMAAAPVEGAACATLDLNFACDPDKGGAM